MPATGASTDTQAEPIRFQPYDTATDPLFSILVPSWNNLPFLRLCLDSVRRHSAYEHQIVVHVNEGADSTRAWVNSQEIDHSYSLRNVGVCRSLNAAATMARTRYIVYMNDDMYALPGWDRSLYEAIEALGHDRFFLSGTMIEPAFTNNPCALAPYDFGTTVEDFREEELLAAFARLEKPDWCGATWPPNVVSRRLWEQVGGYSEEFSPGMSSDPDFSQKLWLAGVRHFQGLGDSRVYHFQAKSTGKITKNPGSQQFLRKWGITQSTFGKYYLRRGQPWRGPLPEPGPAPGLLLATLKSKLKLLLLR